MTSKFILNSKEIEVDQIFLKIGEIRNKSILNKLMEDHQYEIKSLISYEVFESFINFLSKGQSPDLHIDNISEYSVINQEFEIEFIQNLLQSQKVKFRKIEEIINNSNNQMHESYIAQLYNIIGEQKNEIQRLKIDFESYKMEQERQFSIIVEQLLKDEIATNNNEIEAKNEELNDKIKKN